MTDATTPPPARDFAIRQNSQQAELAVNIHSKECTPRAQQRVLPAKLGRTAGTVNAVKFRLCSPQALRNTARYGKIGDFAAWAVDSSADVSKAFEFKNFGVFGALLIQVISGDHFKGISQVGNLSVVTSYIDSVAPPVMYTVRTPDLKPIRMTIRLLASESTSENQGIVRNRINGYLNASARPGVRYTEGSFRDAIVDGVKISFAQVKFEDNATGEFLTTILEYPVLKEVRFAVK